jgi:hypothetical protein
MGSRHGRNEWQLIPEIHEGFGEPHERLEPREGRVADESEEAHEALRPR